MKLFLVTFDLDYTQFLCEARDERHAIEIAYDTNKHLGAIEDYSFDKLIAEDYSVEEVDFYLLTELFRRNDCDNTFKLYNAIVFNY